MRYLFHYWYWIGIWFTSELENHHSLGRRGSLRIPNQLVNGSTSGLSATSQTTLTRLEGGYVQLHAMTPWRGIRDDLLRRSCHMTDHSLEVLTRRQTERAGLSVRLNHHLNGQQYIYAGIYLSLLTPCRHTERHIRTERLAK
jgi:hypothetical protein